MIEARNFQFLVFGLSAAWAIVIAYMFYLVRRDKKLTQELSRLRDMLSDREKSQNCNEGEEAVLGSTLRQTAPSPPQPQKRSAPPQLLLGGFPSPVPAQAAQSRLSGIAA